MTPDSWSVFTFIFLNNIHLKISLSQSKNLVTVGLNNSGKGYLSKFIFLL